MPSMHLTLQFERESDKEQRLCVHPLLCYIITENNAKYPKTFIPKLSNLKRQCNVFQDTGSYIEPKGKMSPIYS